MTKRGREGNKEQAGEEEERLGEAVYRADGSIMRTKLQSGEVRGHKQGKTEKGSGRMNQRRGSGGSAAAGPSGTVGERERDRAQWGSLKTGDQLRRSASTGGRRGRSLGGRHRR